MRRRRTLLAVGAVLCLALVGWQFAWPTAPRPDITRENYERIREGMTEAEVQGVLGGPPGQYTHRPDERVFIPADEDGWWREWAGDDAIIWVRFTPDANDRSAAPVGIVINKHFELREPEPFLGRLRRLLPW